MVRQMESPDNVFVYLRRDGEVYGPYPRAQFAEMILTKGDIIEGELASIAGDQEWSSPSAVAEAANDLFSSNEETALAVREQILEQRHAVERNHEIHVVHEIVMRIVVQFRRPLISLQGDQKQTDQIHVAFHLVCF